MKSRIALFLSLLALTASATFAGSISINFGEIDGGVDRFSLNSGTNYGAVSVDGANWNAFSGKENTSAQALKNEAGATTGATVTWTSPNTYRTSVNTPTTADARLFWSYLDDSSGNTITVTNVPYELYDVYIYASSDNAQAFYFSKVNSTAYTFNTTHGGTVQGPLAWGDGKSSNAANATLQLGKNYMVVSNQTAGTMVLNRTRNGSTSQRGCTSAIQIVNALPDDYAWTKTDAASVISLSDSSFSGLKATFPESATTATVGKNVSVDILKLDGGKKDVASTFTTGSNTLSFTGDHKTIYANSLAAGAVLKLQGSYSGDFTLYGVGDTNTTCADNGHVDLTGANLSGTVTVASGILDYNSFTAKNSNLVFDGGGVYFNSNLTIANPIKVDSSMAFRVCYNTTTNLDGKYLVKASAGSLGLIRRIDSGTLNITGTPGSFNGTFQNETYTTNFQANALNGTAMNIMTVGGTVNIADTKGYTGTITAMGGTTTVTSLSAGTLAVTGGTVNLNEFTGGNVQISGGTMNLSGSSFTGGTVTATGGTMNLSGLTETAAFSFTSNWGTITLKGLSDYSVLTGNFQQTGTSSTLNFEFAQTTLTDAALPNIQTNFNSSSSANSNVNVLFPSGLTSGTLDVSGVTGGGRLTLGTQNKTQNLTITGTANTQFLTLNSVNATLADGAVLTSRQIAVSNGATLTLNDGSGFRAAYAAPNTTNKYVDIWTDVTLNNATDQGILFDVSTGNIYTAKDYTFGGTGDVHVVGGGTGMLAFQGPATFTGTIYVENGKMFLSHKSAIPQSNKVVLGNGVTCGQLAANENITQTFDQVELRGPVATVEVIKNANLTISSFTRTNDRAALCVIVPSTATLNLSWNSNTVSSTTGAADMIPNALYMTGTGDAYSARVATVVDGKVSVLATADHYAIAGGDVDVAQATGKDLLISANTYLKSDLTARSLNTQNDFLFSNNGSTLTLTSGTAILRGANFWVKNFGSLKSSYSSDGGKTTDFYVITTGEGTDKAFNNVSVKDYSATQPTNLIRSAQNPKDVFKLYSDQAYTGYTQVNSGTLFVGTGSGTSSAKLQTSDFRVLGNGKLTISYTPAHEIYSVAKGGVLELNVGTDAQISAMNGSGGSVTLKNVTKARISGGSYDALNLTGTTTLNITGPQTVSLGSYSSVTDSTLNLNVTNDGAPTVNIETPGTMAGKVTVTAGTNALLGNYDQGYTLTNTPSLLTGATIPTGWKLDSKTAVLTLDSQNAVNGGEAIPVGGTFEMKTHNSLGWAAFESTEDQNAAVTLTLGTAANDPANFASWLSEQWGTDVTAVDSTTYNVPLSFKESPVLAWDLSKYTTQTGLGFTSGSALFVPEPAMWVLLLLGVGFLLCGRWKAVTYVKVTK